jgi:2-amino-4-hydroxy-6-hydroxymethyldihydropteridine diphosphokinase
VVCLIVMTPALIYISLGTNLGDRMVNLRLARAALPPDIQVIVYSSIYETEPWGYPDQPSFLNQVVKAQTSLSAPALLAALKVIERNLGRRPTFRYGPRLIDLDILLYGTLVLDTPMLTIPHPRLMERAFVLVPLAELSPDLVHPILGKTIREVLSQVGDQGVKLFDRG